MSQVNKVYFGEDKIIGYSEKNLCPVFDLISNGEKGITYIRNRDGSIRVFGTATAKSVCYIIHPSLLYNMPAGTYSYTMGTQLPEGVGICFEYYDETGNTWIGNYGNLGYWRESYTANFIENTSLSIYISVNEGTKVNLTLYPQIEVNTTLSDYEPYEIHQSIAKKPEGLKKIYVGDETGLAKLIYQGTQDLSTATVILGSALIYNGTEQTQTVSSIVLQNKTLIEGTDYTISNNTATNAGSYTLIITGINDYEGTIAVAYSIAKAAGSISVSPASLTVSGGVGSTAIAEITYIGDGAISVESNATSVATVSKSETTVTVKSVSKGSAIITITLAEGTNYTSASGTINVTVTISAFGSYSGTYSTSDVTINGIAHKLYTLKKSGTLVLNDTAKVWMCGGGGAGGGGMANTMGGTSGGGGGGGGGYVKSGTLEAASYSIVIGSGASSSTYDGGTTQVLKNSETLYSTQGGKGGTDGYRSGNSYYGGTGGAGGSGGGGGGLSINEWYRYGLLGSGAGTSTYPFGLTGLYAHCAGGGGGGTNSSYGGGWYGGSNGANGGGRISSSNSSSSGTQAGTNTGGTGGEKGGGNGGSVRVSSPYVPAAATAGSFYGAGGGGGYADSAGGTSTAVDGSGAKGYQGVVYIAVPA